MLQTMNRCLRPVLLGLFVFGLSLPVLASPAATDTVHHKAVAHKSADTRTHAASRHRHHSVRISRYGRHRSRVSSLSQAEQKRLSLQLGHQGPSEIFQAADAHSPLYLQSRAAVVMNAETGEILYSKNPERSMPIASITKLMTAMVVLDAHLPMDEPVTITDADVDTLRHSSSRLPVGTTLPRREMMLLALMASENRAASALARTYPGGTEAAVAAMNRKARDLGMTSARFLDPTGLHSENSASPADLVRMVKTARTYPEIHEFTTTTEHVATIHNREVEFRNTNALVKSDAWNIEVSKTGYINEAGKCLVMQARISATPVVIVLMDSSGRYTRIGDANRVKKWLESALDLPGDVSHNQG